MAIPAKRRKSSSDTLGDTRKQQTMTRLMDAAESLIHDHGYDNTSVTDIAKAAGVVPSLINAYFLGKAGLLYAVAQRFNAAQLEHTRQAAAAPGPASLRLARIIETWARIDLARPRLTAALNSLSWAWPRETEVQYRSDLRPFFDILRHVHADGVAAGEFIDLPEDEIFDLVLGVYLWGLRPGVFAANTPENCAARIVRHVMNALARQGCLADRRRSRKGGGISPSPASEIRQPALRRR